MNREQMIKEARTIEAMKKGYMGLEGKFGMIAKRLGNSIINQGSLYLDATYLEDPYEIPDEQEIPVMDEELQSYEVGSQFEGLSSGINMTISVQYHLREIVVRWQGKIVYKELSGELEGYVPDLSWEDKIEELYEIARKKERRMRPLEREQLIESTTKKKKEIMEYLKNKWGL